jgi:colicin import membrane protein
MILRTISRSAIGGYVKLLRLPMDAAVRLRARNGNGPSGGMIALDRFEANLRSIAGRALRDDALVHDAERRRVATDQRARAIRLRAEANRRSELAEERLSEKEQKAEQQRRRASQRAAERKQQAEKRLQAERRRIADVEAQRRRANERAAAAKEDAIKDRSKRARLQQLDREADALAKKQDALAAKSESQRLRQAASKTKASRKNGAANER